jgi:hypothetical protein
MLKERSRRVRLAHGRWLKCAGFAVNHQPSCHQAGSFSGLASVVVDTSDVTETNWRGADHTLCRRVCSVNTHVIGSCCQRTAARPADLSSQNPPPSAADWVGSTVSPTSPYCPVAYGILTQLRGLATYTIPRIDVQVSGVMQSKPGPILSANYAVPASVIAQTLGRAPAGNVTNVTVNLLPTGTLYGDRVNQLDFRVGKLLKFAGKRTLIALDLYNALNANPILTYNNTFAPGTWLQPRSILTPRLFRVSAEFNF